MRVLFLGSDRFSYPSLKALHGLVPDARDLLVATRLLKPSGRGHNTIVEPPVVEYARAHGLAWREIETAADFGAVQADFCPDLAVAVSYGKLIPASFISGLKFGGLNVHPSLLPQYRGAAPLQRAIMDLQPRTGVSVQTLHPTKFDHGRVLWQQAIDMPDRVTLPELRDELADLGARGLAEVVERRLYDGGSEVELSEVASKAALIDRAEYRIDFKRSAPEVDAAGRALGKLWFEQAMTVVKKRKETTKKVRVILSDFEPVRLVDSEPVGTVQMVGSGAQAVLALKVAGGYIGARTATVAGFGRQSALEYFAQRKRRGLGEVDT